MSLLRSDPDFEPVAPTPTAPSAYLYGALGAVLALLAFVLISSTAYKENAGVTLSEAQTRTRTALPVVLALVGSSLALFVQARLCWTRHRLAVPLGTALIASTAVAAALLPSSLRGYAFAALGLQVVALGVYVWLRARALKS